MHELKLARLPSDVASLAGASMPAGEVAGVDDEEVTPGVRDISSCGTEITCGFCDGWVCAD